MAGGVEKSEGHPLLYPAFLSNHFPQRIRITACINIIVLTTRRRRAILLFYFAPAGPASLLFYNRASKKMRVLRTIGTKDLNVYFVSFLRSFLPLPLSIHSKEL